MESLSYRTGEDARWGGTDITISLTAREAAALSPDLEMLADWFDTALWALAAMRTGESYRGPGTLGEGRTIGTGDAYDMITALDHRLLPRLEAIRDAAIRRHEELGGTVQELADAMDVSSRSTAQYRREALRKPDRKEPFRDWVTTNH
ncbi:MULTISPECIES: hypothetical protein [unclassified Streptomyces]|uniref:hypothetical protein n=1 Tax=unclassified Streptomyces TaxID=2593676 RepID=UPI002252BDC7|nr:MULTISPECIES: hypothetical protein [unclassified Streptomyces]MCX4871113.1 hypothetical protein [Streptomyces sp. NBC_00906]MCX4902735.1 hypothetical protein [Streptomyces sp. NBC_00892]